MSSPSAGSGASRDARRRRVGKWRELGVAGHARKPAGAPILGGLIDPFLSAGDEVPEDMALALKRFAAKQYESGRADGGYDDRRSGLEDDQPTIAEPSAGDLDLAFHDIGGALDMVGSDLQPPAIGNNDVRIEGVGKYSGGGLRPSKMPASSRTS